MSSAGAEERHSTCTQPASFLLRLARLALAGEPRRGSASLRCLSASRQFCCPWEPRFPLGILDLEAPSSSPPGGFSPWGALSWAILNIQIHFYACTVVEGARLPLWHANESPFAAQGLSRGTRPSPRHFPQVAPWSQGGVGGARGSFLRLPLSFIHPMLSGRRGEGSCCSRHARENGIFKAKSSRLGREEVKHSPRPAPSALGAARGAQHPQGWGRVGQCCSRTSP